MVASLRYGTNIFLVRIWSALEEIQSESHLFCLGVLMVSPWGKSERPIWSII